MNLTAINGHRGKTGHRSGRGTVVLFLHRCWGSSSWPRILNDIIIVTIIVDIVLILSDTRTGTINITTSQPLDVVEVGAIIDTCCYMVSNLLSSRRIFTNGQRL